MSKSNICYDFFQAMKILSKKKLRKKAGILGEKFVIAKLQEFNNVITQELFKNSNRTNKMTLELLSASLKYIGFLKNSFNY